MSEMTTEKQTALENSVLQALDAADASLVDLAISILDPKDALRKYSKLGGEVLKRAQKGKASLPTGQWKGKEDIKTICDRLELLVRMRTPIKTVQMNVYLRVHLWVEAMKPLVPGVEKLSFHQVQNKFLTTLDFDADALTGGIKSAWIGWVTSAVERQLSDEPMGMTELDAFKKEHEASIERKKNSTGDPEKDREKAEKALENKRRAERKAATAAVRDAAEKALEDGTLTPVEVQEAVVGAMKDCKASVPNVFDGSTVTKNDVLKVAKDLFTAGKFVEMKVLRDALDVMLKAVESGSVSAKEDAKVA